MKIRYVRIALLVVMALGVAAGMGATSPVRAQDEPYAGSFDVELGGRATVVARVMVEVPVTVTCTMPSVPWETDQFNSSAALQVSISQAAGRGVVRGYGSLDVASLCDGATHSLVVNVFGDAPFKGGPAVVSAYGGVSFYSWYPGNVSLETSDWTGYQEIRIGG